MRAIPDLLVVLAVAGLSAWAVYHDRVRTAVHATRTVAWERRELVASHLEATVGTLGRIAAALATGTPPPPADGQVLGLWWLDLEGAPRGTLVDPGPRTPQNAADARAGRWGWTILSRETLPGGQLALRLAGPLRARPGEPAEGVLVALVDASRLRDMLDAPVDRRVSVAASLAARRGCSIQRLDSAAARSVPDAEVGRALDGEEGAALHTGPEGPHVLAQASVGFGAWSLVMRVPLDQALPGGAIPLHIAIPLWTVLGLFVVLVRRAGGEATGGAATADARAPRVPSPHPADGVPVVDRARFAKVAGAVGRALPGILATFQADLAKRVATVRDACEPRDAATIEDVAHAIGGSAANLGLDRLGHVARWLEDFAGKAGATELADAVRVLEREAEAGSRGLTEEGADRLAGLDASLSEMAYLYVRIDPDLKVRALSSAVARDRALAECLSVGRPFVDTAVPADRERLREALCALESGPRRELVDVQLDASGAPRPVAWALCRAPGGRGVLAFGRELHAAETEAAALRSKAELLATMIHEVRTPMNAVIGMSGLLLGTELTDEQHECAQVVRVAAENLLALVNDILDYSKIDAGRMELEAFRFDLRRAADDVVDLVALEARRREVALAVEVDGPLPAAVVGDLSRLRQVLTNLTDNALKFTPAGGAVTLRLRARPGAIVRFEVHDTGAGIAAEALARLFQPFVQADPSTPRRHGGTGLGLALCKRLVALMGGEIGVTSEVGRGSSFWFELPLPEAPPAPPEPCDAEACVGPMPFPLRVLVVDDNAVNQVVASRMLARLDVKADVAGSGREALEMLTLLPYDLVLMDVRMADMDGPEATRRLRELEREGTRIPIVALTANPTPDTRARCMAAGMDDYLAKPVTLGALRAAVARWAPAQPRVSWREANTAAVEAMRGLLEDTPRTARHFDGSRFRRIQDLAKQHTDSFFLNVVDVYLTSARQHLAELRAAAAQGDADAARRHAQSLRHSSERMGALGLVALCASLEELAARPGADLAPTIAQIEAEVDAIAGVLSPRR